MTTETPLETCIFCGKTLVQDNTVIPSMTVCKNCLQGHLQLGKSVGILPPPSVLWRRLLVILPGIAIGLVLGCITSLFVFALLGYVAPKTTAMQVPFVLISGILVFISFTLLWELIFFSRLQHAGNTEWKSHLVKTLNLENVVQRAQATSHLVICCWQKPSWTDLTLPMQIGILLETTQGFIFCGAPDTRAILSLTGIAAVGTERLKIFPPRTALRLDLNMTDGLPVIRGHIIPKQVLFAFMDEKSFKANSEKAKAKQQHIQHILENSRTVENRV